MRQSMILALSALLMSVAVNAGAAGDPAAGERKAKQCASCHGMNGYSGNPQWPNLAGQKEQYLAAQLKAFRDGDRQNDLMSPMAKGLSDQDIQDLAAYYATLPCKDK